MGEYFGLSSLDRDVVRVGAGHEPFGDRFDILPFRDWL